MRIFDPASDRLAQAIRFLRPARLFNRIRFSFALEKQLLVESSSRCVMQFMLCLEKIPLRHPFQTLKSQICSTLEPSTLNVFVYRNLFIQVHTSMTIKETKAPLPLKFQGLVINVYTLIWAPMEETQKDMPGTKALLNMHYMIQKSH